MKHDGPTDTVVVMMVVMVVVVVRFMRHRLEPERDAVGGGVKKEPDEREAKGEAVRANLPAFAEALRQIREQHTGGGQGPRNPRTDDLAHLREDVKADQIDDRGRDEPLKTAVQHRVASECEIHEGARGERSNAQG